jgi:hypothetical protein
VNQPSSLIRQRDDLKYLQGIEVTCSGRVKEFRKHVTRRSLDSVLLVNVIITPLEMGESISVDHLWMLKRDLKKLGRVPDLGERIFLTGRVYSYKRLGGKSVDRGLFGTEDFGVAPLSYIS